MKAILQNGWGYRGDKMNLPVRDLEASIPYYEKVMGFLLESRSEVPHKSAVLERDGVRIGLAENGDDPSQDGCAFHVENVESLFNEFLANGWEPPPTRAGANKFETEAHGEDGLFKVFYVVAPDGLCYWFGERQASTQS